MQASLDEFDFVIIGSGIAGLSCALKAAAHGRVAVLTKRRAEDSNTAWAQGGVACVTSDEDSFELHVADTLDAGAGLCDEEVVRRIIEQGPERIQELVDWGVEFDQRLNKEGVSENDLTMEGGHSKRRVLHARDATGHEIVEKLLAAVREHPGIEVMENVYAIDLITTAKLGLARENRVVGLYALDQTSGEVLTIGCERVILCAGGCGKVYLYTTNPDIATGDGVAMAWRAGATIANMEFIQFHPTCLYHHEVRSFLISEAVRGEGGVLIDAMGNPFMHKYDVRESLAPRDIVARAIDAEMKRTGSRCVYVDITHQSESFLKERFPNIYSTCKSVGIDIAKDPIPVVPAAHYMCGGIETDLNGRTSLRGLYAVGENACNGLHGANRLASNSLLEGVVVAHLAIEDMVRDMSLDKAGVDLPCLPRWVEGDVQDVDELVVIYHNWDEIRRCMWDYVGIVRTDKRLQRAATRLQNLRREVQEFYWNFKITTDLLELRNLVEIAALVVDSSQMRKESRGLHYNVDHPLSFESQRHSTRITKS